MKIIVGIIASDNESYTEFKKVWIQNIIMVKMDPYLSNIFDFYFLYSDSKGKSTSILNKENNTVLYVDYYDNKDNFEDVTHSMFARTISFFEYMIHTFELFKEASYHKHVNEGLYFLRTNLSTVFDFKLMLTWFENKPKLNFFGGSFNGYYNGIITVISGTNLILSFDMMVYLTINKEKVRISEMFEDEAISSFLIMNLQLFLINVKRLDFIEMDDVVVSPTHTWPGVPKSIVYHKTDKQDEDIFTFRFKTFDRENDIEIMKYVVNEIWKNDYRLLNMVYNIANAYTPPLSVKEELPTYNELYSKSPFKIFHLNFDEKLEEEVTIKIE